jgi:hypothetical protein
MDQGVGTTYDLDYIWFPKHSDASWMTTVPDVAVLHTRQAFTSAYLLVMSASAMPNPGNISGYYSTAAPVVMVGYSSYDTPELDSRRRYGYAKAKKPPDFGTDASGGIDYSALFEVEGNVTGSHRYETCEGDSGGPAVFGTAGSYQVGGVLHGGLGACSSVSQYAYIPRGFLDALCRDSQGGPVRHWEDCLSVPANDPDLDGKTGTADKCPYNPNVDQTNSNADTEAGLHSGSQTILGDACDPKPLATIPGKQLQQTDVYLQGTYSSAVYWLKRTWSEAIVVYRAMGYVYNLDGSNNYTAGGIDVSRKLKPYYCACHNWANSTSSSPDEITNNQVCMDQNCYEDGDPHANIYRDTGWQFLNWSEPGGSCQRKDLDGDDPTGTGKPYNECDTELPARKYLRALGGTVYCTDRNELGCQSGDYEKYWKDSSAARTKRFTWDWRSQDYPHDPDPTKVPIYDPTQTPWARVKVWLRPDSSDLGSTNNNVYTTPQKLVPGMFGTVGRPLYDPPRLRWLLPALPDPAGPFGPLVVVPVDRATGTEQLPASFDWTPIAESSATRALLVSSVDPSAGNFGEARASRYVGPAGLDLDTVDFGLAQVDDAVYALGGEDLGGALSNMLWVGLNGASGEMDWDVPAGVAGSGASSATVSTTSTTSTSKTAKSSPSQYEAWLAAEKKARPIKRTALSVLAAATSPGSSSGAKSGGKGSTVTVKSMVVPNGPEPQRGPVLGPNLAAMTLTAVFGETASDPPPGSPVSFAIYDIYYQEWVTVQAAWNCGPRHSVGYTSVEGGPEVFFYGGELQGALLEGLYRITLDPSALLEGQDVERLDNGSPESPAARSYAAMVHQPWEQAVYLFGGIGPNGALNDLWRFSLADGTWKRLSDGTEPGSPPATIGAGLLVSRTDGSILVVAGTASAATNERAWRYQGGQWEATTQWTQ